VLPAAGLAGGITRIPRRLLLQLELLLGGERGKGGGLLGDEPGLFLLLAALIVGRLPDQLLLTQAFPLGIAHRAGLCDETAFLGQLQQPGVIRRRSRFEFLQEVLFSLERRIAAFDEIIVLEARHTLFSLATTRARASNAGRPFRRWYGCVRLHTLPGREGKRPFVGGQARAHRSPDPQLSCMGGVAVRARRRYLCVSAILRVIVMATGTVKWFNLDKGYGFITPQDGGKDVFLHITAVQAAGLNSVNDGQKVSYDVVTERGKQAASNLKKLG
jgi:CspA family cold shock protein